MGTSRAIETAPGSVAGARARAMIAAAASMPPGWVAPGQVSATFADSAQEAERQSVRMSHVETGFAGKVPQPAIIEGTLTADMAQSLATGHSELPGEGPAVVEASSLSPTFEARANSSASNYSVSTSEGDDNAEREQHMTTMNAVVGVASGPMPAHLKDEVVSFMMLRLLAFHQVGHLASGPYRHGSDRPCRLAAPT